MSQEMLLGWSLALVGIAFVFAVLTFVFDRKSNDDFKEVAEMRHPGSILSQKHRGYAVFFLLFLATAYSSDVAFEWLASIALCVLFGSFLLDRIITYIMVRMGITPQDPAPKAEARAAAGGDAEPEPFTEMAVNVAGIIVTLISWAAIISLAILFVMSFVEVVLPHYLGVIGWLA